MSKKYLLGFIVLTVLFVSIGLVLLRINANAISGVTDYSEWRPNPAEIRAKIGSSQNPNSNLSLRERHETFAKMFKSRFRSQKEMVAVSVKLSEDSNQASLLFPARMEPWQVDAVALMVWRECKDLFGVSYDINFYKTYLGAHTLIKDGQLRASKENPKLAIITREKPVDARPGRAEVDTFMNRRVQTLFK